jgi:inosine/xanthosine triphosphatase
MKKVIICSNNPVKIEASKEAFLSVFPENNYEFIGQSINSLVSDQPMSQKETYEGSLNRAKNARQQFKADYYVGIEGGIEIVNDELECFAWVVILSDDNIGKAKTGSFFLPKKLAELVKQGHELGKATDMVFSSHNAKQKGGAVSFLTNKVLSRKTFYKPAIVMALIPFINKDLY